MTLDADRVGPKKLFVPHLTGAYYEGTIVRVQVLFKSLACILHHKTAKLCDMSRTASQWKGRTFQVAGPETSKLCTSFAHSLVTPEMCP